MRMDPGHIHIDHVHFPQKVRPHEGSCDSESRVIDKNINLPPHQVFAQADQILVSGQIRGQQQALSAQLSAQHLKPVPPAGDQDQRIALQRKAPGKFQSDSGAGSGDQSIILFPCDILLILLRSRAGSFRHHILHGGLQKHFRGLPQYFSPLFQLFEAGLCPLHDSCIQN